MLTPPKRRFLATTLFLLSVFIPSISAAFEIKDYFNVATTGAGSCGKYLPALSNYLEEAFEMATAGYNAIQRLQDKKATFTDARHFTMLWGLDMASVHKNKHESTASEVDEINYVKAIYFYSKLLKDKNKKPRLYCDSKFLEYTETAYDISTGEKTDVSLFEAGVSKDPKQKGAYWSADDKWYGFDAEYGPDVTPCKGTTGGFRIPTLQTIVLCPFLLEGPKKQSLRQYVSGEIPINTGDKLDSYTSIPGAFLHEIAHLVGEEYQPEYNDAGVLVKGQKSYEYEAIANLAWNYPNLSKFNADTYNYFAMASYLKTKDWAVGKAEDVIQVSSSA